LTTAQLQGTTTVGLGAAFTGGAAGGIAGLYPYLASAFPDGLQAVSGIAYKNGGSITAASSASGPVFVGLTLDGVAQRPVATGANGYYYAAVPAGTISASGTTLLATTAADVTTGTRDAATIATGVGTTTGLDVFGGFLPFTTAATSYASVADASAALRASVAGYSSTPAFVASLPSLISATGASFTIDQALTTASGLAVRTTAANAPITLNAAVTLSGAATLQLSAAGALTINAPIAASNTASLSFAAGTLLAVAAPITLAGTSAATLNAGSSLAVNAPITLAGTNALTLVSGGPIAIGQTVHVTDAGSVVLAAAPVAGLTTTGVTFASGASIDYGAVDRGASFSLNGNAYKLVYSMSDLDAVDSISAVDGTALTRYGAGLGGNYALATDLGAGGTTYTQALFGTSASRFGGRLDGLGHAITGLTISAPATDYIGLVGYQSGAGSSISNIGLVGGSVVGLGNVGALVGTIDSAATVQTSYATGTVTANREVGGLVGSMFFAGNVQSSYATGAVRGAFRTGGLVGAVDFASTVQTSYATGAVAGTDRTGGLVGYISQSTVKSSYATGAVTGTTKTGGLIGESLAGSNAIISGSFWNTQTSGTTISDGGTGLSTAQMRTQANFTTATAANGNLDPAWDFANTWLMYDAFTAPLLRSFLVPLTATANSTVKTYDGLAYAGANGVTYSSLPNGNLLGTLSYADASQGAVNVGTYAVTPGGLHSNQQGYAISYASGSLRIDPATLTVAADAANRLYGATNPAFSGSVSGFVGADTLASATTGSEAFVTSALVNSNVGQYAVTGSGLAANDGNYVFVQAPGNATALTIGAATLTVASNAASRLYGAGDPAFGGSVTGFVAGDTLASATTGSAAFATTALVGSNVGSYAITGSGLSANNGNYVFAQAPGNATALTIAPATLTVSSNTASRQYGAAEPSFSGTVSGFVAGDTLASATSGSEVFGTAALSNSNVGSYAITGSGLVANGGNYVFVQAPGNATALTIDPAMLTYLANPANRLYGAVEPAFSGTVSGFVAGETLASATTGREAYSTSAPAGSNVGRYAITGSGLAANHGNYVFTQAAGNATALTIDPATLTLTANAASRQVGVAEPLFSGGVSGFVLGETQTTATTGSLAFATDARVDSSPGRYAIDGSGLVANQGNYAFVQAAANATALTIAALAPMPPPVVPPPGPPPVVPPPADAGAALLLALLAPLNEATGDAFFLGSPLSPVVKTRRKTARETDLALLIVEGGQRLPQDALGSGR
jgi:hypothetical protein